MKIYQKHVHRLLCAWFLTGSWITGRHGEQDRRNNQDQAEGTGDQHVQEQGGGAQETAGHCPGYQTRAPRKLEEMSAVVLSDSNRETISIRVLLSLLWAMNYIW